MKLIHGITQHGVGKLGTVKSLPMTLLAQYRFGDANSAFRPFVGAGPTCAVPATEGDVDAYVDAFASLIGELTT